MHTVEEPLVKCIAIVELKKVLEAYNDVETTKCESFVGHRTFIQLGQVV